MKARSIKELVEIALSKSNALVVYSLGKPGYQTKHKLESLLQIDLGNECERIIDTYGVKHAIGEHGSPGKEARRGQIAITIDDFDLLPSIFGSPDEIEYAGKNRYNQDLIRYKKRFDYYYVIVEAVRVAKNGNKLVFTTMYKKK